MKKLAILTLLAMAASAATAQEWFEKQVVFPADADSVTKIEMASRLVPSQKQVQWQNLGLTAFVHFGVNTYTDREWGDGSENPNIFNPVGLDCEQWVKTLTDAGFKMVILTAKHHDGFCLWPTATTDHSVRSSAWRDGQGDVVADLKAACDKYGMKLGLYLSPWDRNAPVYGDSPKYNDMFVAQLTEILTNYGKIDEVWFDGACGEGPNGKKQVYDWDRFAQTISTLQPDAVMAIMGDDVRWVGNERGMGRDTEWSATAICPGIYPQASASNDALGLKPKAPDLGSRDIVAKADALYWWPSEVDVSIRDGWFYHENQHPKSLEKLADIYVNSVGKNSVLLLNIPPTPEGKFADEDVQRLLEFGKWIDDNFGIAGQARYHKNRANCAVLAEDITKGQRIESFDILSGDQVIASGTTVGNKRIVTFPDTAVDSLTVRINQYRGDDHYLLPVEYFMIAMPAPEAKKPVDADLAPKGMKALQGTVVADNADYIVVDFGKAVEIAAISYIPQQPQAILRYQLLPSKNGKKWGKDHDREFSNIANNPVPQVVTLDKPIKARYIKLQATTRVPVTGETDLALPADTTIAPAVKFYTR